MIEKPGRKTWPPFCVLRRSSGFIFLCNIGWKWTVRKMLNYLFMKTVVTVSVARLFNSHSGNSSSTWWHFSTRPHLQLMWTAPRNSSLSSNNSTTTDCVYASDSSVFYTHPCWLGASWRHDVTGVTLQWTWCHYDGRLAGGQWGTLVWLSDRGRRRVSAVNTGAMGKISWWGDIAVVHEQERFILSYCWYGRHYR